MATLDRRGRVLFLLIVRPEMNSWYQANVTMLLHELLL